MRRLGDLLLGTEPLQRVRHAQALLAIALMSAGVAALQWFVAAGQAPAAAMTAWAAVALLGMAAFYLAIRAGWTRGRSDPSLTVPQMVFALACAAAAYALLGAGRGAVFLMVMVVLMFGMFVVSPRQMRAVSLYAVLLFGAVMAAMARLRPEVYVPSVEAGHFLLFALMVPGVSLLAGRLSRLRHRARLQRQELKEALARIRELATRDELTGLINRRHMQQVMEQEHRRCIRSGQTFCLAMLDVDGFRRVNERHGTAVGDEVLHALAREAQHHMRISDVLARWGGEEFVLMLSDTRAPLARGGVERLRERLAALRVVAGPDEVGVTLAAGLAEHHAGETVTQTLERAERALDEAKAQGGDRVVVAA